MGPDDSAVEKLIALSLREKVKAYTRHSKTGKLVQVSSYTRDPGKMSNRDLFTEFRALTRAPETIQPGGAPTPDAAKNRKVQIIAEIRKRQQAGQWDSKVAPSPDAPVPKPKSKVPPPEVTRDQTPVNTPMGGVPNVSDHEGGKAPVQTEKTASPELDALEEAHGVKAVGTGKGTVDDPVNCAGNVMLAAKLLQEGKHVRLNKVDEVGTLLDKLAEIALEAKAKGEKAPLYDLCKVSVPKTNLFCAQSKGIERAKMPQLGGMAVPGSKADALPRVRGEEVDITDQFMAELELRGIGVSEKQVPAASLKATQSELIGAKVAGIEKAMEKAPADSSLFDPIFVTKDNYVIDGHHRWAAEVGLDAQDGHLGDQLMNVRMIDMEIGEALDFSNAFAKAWGIQQVGADAPPDVVTTKKTEGAVDSLKAKMPAEKSSPTASTLKEKTKAPAATYPPIGKAELSNPNTPRTRKVSAEEFNKLAAEGEKRLTAMRDKASDITGMEENWSKITERAWQDTRKEWGGTTVDAHTGQPIEGNPDKYALTVKAMGLHAETVPINASREEFEAAMERAKKKFGKELRYQQHHLGIFRDEDNGRIDIDPVLVVDSLDDVETIGSYTKAVGGAYHFSDGDGYWPPYVG